MVTKDSREPDQEEAELRALRMALRDNRATTWIGVGVVIGSVAGVILGWFIGNMSAGVVAGALGGGLIGAGVGRLPQPD